MHVCAHDKSRLLLFHEKVDSLVIDAIEKGATKVTGGNKSMLGENFYEPTLLANVTLEMECATNEIFGPVASVIR